MDFRENCGVVSEPFAQAVPETGVDWWMKRFIQARPVHPADIGRGLRYTLISFAAQASLTELAKTLAG
jgi:hypothetical protein